MYDINANMRPLDILQSYNSGARLGLDAQEMRQKQQQQATLDNDNKALADILRGDTNAITRLQSPELIQKAQNHLRELEQRKALQGFYTPATKDQYQANVTQNPIAAIMDGGKKPSNLVQAQQPSFQESQAPTMLDMLQTGKIESGKPASYDIEGAGNYLMGQGNFDQLGKLTDYRKAIAKDEAEWGTNPTKGINPNTMKPDSYITDRKGNIKWLGSGVYEAPKDPKVTPLMRNGQLVTVGVPNTPEVKILMSDGTLMSGGSIPKPESLEDSTNSFTPAAIDNAAARYNIDGTLPPMGMGKGGSAARSQILNRAAVLASGVNGTDQRVAQLTTKASASTLLQLKKTKTMIKAFEKMANKNADIALEMSAKVDRTGTPVVNRWFLAANNKIAGDVDTATFNTAINVFANEYAKIMSGSMGNTPVSDSARKEAHEILNTAQTPAQLQANIRLLQREMKNRLIGLDESEAELIQQMKGGKKEDAHGKDDKKDPYKITKDMNPKYVDYLMAHKELVRMKDFEGANMLTEMYKRGAK